MKRIILLILYGAVFLVCIGLLAVSALSDTKQDLSFWLKGSAVTISIGGAFIATLLGTPAAPKKVAHKKTYYKTKFAEYIGRAFAMDAKAEKKLYQAIDFYVQQKPSAALSILEKLRDECQQRDDIYAVATFTGLCCHDLKLYDKAIGHYTRSLQLRAHSTIASNMGLCHERLGNYDPAVEAYLFATDIDPQNAYAHNNLAVLLIRLGEYERALGYAEQAVSINQRMPQALNSLAVCHYMMGNMEQYQKYYRQAVSAGSDGAKLKAYIASLDATVQLSEHM